MLPFLQVAIFLMSHYTTLIHSCESSQNSHCCVCVCVCVRWAAVFHDKWERTQSNCWNTVALPILWVRMDVPPEEGGDSSMHLADFWWKVKIVSITLLWPSKQQPYTHTHTLSKIFDSKSLFVYLVMEQDSVSYQTIMNLHKHIFFFLHPSVQCSDASEAPLQVHGHMNSQFCSDWGDKQKIGWYSGCHNQFKRNYRRKVDEDGQKDITIIYLIVQTRVIALLFPWFCPKKLPFHRAVSFLQRALPVSISCCSYFFV